MDLIDKFLRDIPRDGDGFENIDDFWRDSEKINFPLPTRVKSRLFDAANSEINKCWAQYQRAKIFNQNATEKEDESDTDFDYDTASSISVDIDELLLSDDEPENKDNDEHPSNGGATEGLESSVKSMQLSPSLSLHSPVKDISEPSTVKISPEVTAEATTDSLSPSILDVSGVPDYSMETARGDKSSLITNKSFGEESISSKRSSRSRASSTKTPQVEKRTSENEDNLLSSIKKPGGKGSASARRVSFNEGSIMFSPEPSIPGFGDASTVREDRSYEIASSAGSLSTSTAISPVTSPTKSFSKKSITSIMDASTPGGSPPGVTSSTDMKSKEDISPVVASPVSVSSKRSNHKEEKTTPSTKHNESAVSKSSLKLVETSISKKTPSKKVEEVEDGSTAKSTPKSVRSNRSTLSATQEIEKEEDQDETQETQEEESEEIELSKSKVSTKSSASKRSRLETSRNSSKVSSASKRSLLREEEKSEEVPSPAISSTSKASRSLQFSASKSIEEASPPRDEDYNGGYDDYDYGGVEAEEDGEDRRQSMSRISKTTSTPSLSEKSMSPPLSPSVKQTPKSAQSSISKALATPASVYTEAISTPGSNEFPRGRRLADESFNVSYNEEDVDDQSTDKEEMDASAFSPSKSHLKGKRGKGGKKHSLDNKNQELLTDAELSTTFIDKDYLQTISSANKKYAGHRILEETKQLKKEQKLKEEKDRLKKKRRKVELLDTDEEPEEGLGGDEDDASYDDDEEAVAEGLRRSRRATKGRRFAFWKGERPVYQEGTLVDIITVSPTPKKQRKVLHRTKKEGGGEKRKRKATAESSEEDEEVDNDRLISTKKKSRTTLTATAGHDSDLEKAEPVPPVELPKQYKYQPAAKAEALTIYDSSNDVITQEMVICCRSTLPPPHPLPRTAKRPPGKNGVGAARHLFNIRERPGIMPGWIAGFMDLPPQAIKDHENVGPLAQVFFINECQPESLEFSLCPPDEDDNWNDKTAQRVILSAGDSFYVPPQNLYRLENHSKAVTCKINWIIIKPMQELEPALPGSTASHATAVGKK